MVLKLCDLYELELRAERIPLPPAVASAISERMWASAHPEPGAAAAQEGITGAIHAAVRRGELRSLVLLLALTSLEAWTATRLIWLLGGHR